MLSTALRKAAILVSALDERAADALLQQMGPEQAARVRSALMEIEDVPAEEEQQVLAEFLGRQGSPALAAAAAEVDGGVELEISTTELSYPLPNRSPEVAEARSPQTNGQPDDLPLAFLAQVPPAPLARALQGEQPQTIAAIIAHLPAEQTAELLQHLPASLATDALERMATLGPIAPAVLADLERELKARLGAHANGDGSSGESVKRLSAVLEAMDYRQRQRALVQLAQRNANLVSRLGVIPTTTGLEVSGAYSATACRYRIQRPEAEHARPVPSGVGDASATFGSNFAFGELALLGDQSLRAVFAAAEPALLILALTGADERLLSRLFRQLPSRDAALLRQRLDHPGPVRLRDIEQAQQQVAAIAVRLAREGKIDLPRATRFAAAV